MLKERMNKRCFILFAIMPLFVTTACSHPQFLNAKSQETLIQSKHFKPAGQLNYEYDPGVFLPLRNGKILALDGMHYKNEPEGFVQAADGKTYGYGRGMVELFDPASGKTEVLTQLPITFERDVAAAANRRQMQAVELLDGRIFMVGKVGVNATMGNNPLWKPSPVQHRPRTFDDNFHYLPFFSKSKPNHKLKSIAPLSEPNLFGIIYNPQTQEVELVNSAESLPPRWFVAMNLLPDGKVLITGGCITLDSTWKEFPETRVLCFDPKTSKFNVVGQLQHPRFGHQVIPLSPTKFMLINGCGASDSEGKKKYCTYSNSHTSEKVLAPLSQTHEVEIFDLNTGRSKLVGHTLTGRYDFSAIPLKDGTVFIHGGAVGCLLGYHASELYDEKTGTTIYLGENFPDKKDGFASHEEEVPYRLQGEGVDFRAILKGDQILLAGTEKAYVYDWRKIKDRDWLGLHNQPDRLLMPRFHHHLVESSDGRIFVMGGLAYRALTGSSVQSPHRANLIEEFVNSERSEQKL